MLEIITGYITKLFLRRFFIIMITAGVMGFLIEIIAGFGKVNLFDFFLNLGSIFTLVFFVSASWALISLQKTRELVAMQIAGISTLKIIAISMLLTLCFAIFYIFIYNGYFLKIFLEKDTEKFTLKEFEIYQTKENPCNYSLGIWNDLSQISAEEFSAKKGLIIDFENCKLKNKFSLAEIRLLRSGESLSFSNTEVIDSGERFNFEIFKSYFLEKANSQQFSTFIEKIQTIRKFQQFSVNSRKNELEIFRIIQTALSFFYMTLLAFLFFFKLEPRRGIFLQTLSATCLVATIYILNIIFTSYVEKIDLIPPYFLVSPAIFFILFILILITHRRI